MWIPSGGDHSEVAQLTPIESGVGGISFIHISHVNILVGHTYHVTRALLLCISKMKFSRWGPPGVSETMWSVNLDASISGDYQTIGGHSCRPSKKLGVPTTIMGAPRTSLGTLGSPGNKPETAGNISGSILNHSRAVWEKQHLL
jgi:hypothetical protein